jgi:hypothetical protein
LFYLPFSFSEKDLDYLKNFIPCTKKPLTNFICLHLFFPSILIASFSPHSDVQTAVRNPFFQQLLMFDYCFPKCISVIAVLPLRFFLGSHKGSWVADRESQLRYIVDRRDHPPNIERALWVVSHLSLKEITLMRVENLGRVLE